MFGNALVILTGEDRGTNLLTMESSGSYLFIEKNNRLLWSHIIGAVASLHELSAVRLYRRHRSLVSILDSSQ